MDPKSTTENQRDRIYLTLIFICNCDVTQDMTIGIKEWGGERSREGENVLSGWNQ